MSGADLYDDPCVKCEEMMQPFLDHALSDSEYLEAESHLDTCSYCRKRYHFESTLRQYVRRSCVESMDPALKEKLSALRTPLH
jgi:anti-sigma factor (TIGR02949 family)